MPRDRDVLVPELKSQRGEGFPGCDMELHALPVGAGFLIYRPLRRLAFAGNAALVGYLRDRAAGTGRRRLSDAETFLEALDFWQPDPPAPAEWAPAAPQLPTGAVLLMTGDCNLRCSYCYARGGDQPASTLAWPLARRVIDTAHANALARALPEFSLSLHGGGEPTLAWELLTAAVEHARSKSLPCRVSLVTNGVWSDEQRDYLLAHVDDLTISCDGLRDVHDAQRPRPDGSGSFEAVLRSIRAADASAVRFGVRMTTTPASVLRLPESIELLCDLTRRASLAVEPFYGSQRGQFVPAALAEAERFVAAFLSAYHIAAQAGRALTYSGARPEWITTTFCRAAEDSIIVMPNGELVACFEAAGGNHPLAARFAIGGVTEAAVAIELERVRAFAGLQRTRREACRGCFVYWHCAGDCASRRLSPGGQDAARCMVNRRLTQEILCSWVSAGDGVYRVRTRPDTRAAC